METTDDATGSTGRRHGDHDEWSPELATVLTGAVELARAAIIEFSGDDTVGEYLGAGYEDPDQRHPPVPRPPARLSGLAVGRRGGRYPGADHATISEVVLVPGPTALLAPKWVPWEQRVKPGDLGPGDLLAPLSGDPRLVPGFMASGDPQIDEVAAEIGLGRAGAERLGRSEAAQRWHDGDYGPAADGALHPPRVPRLPASTCRSPGRWAPYSVYAATSCRPTGMSSSPNTVAARTPTLRSRGRGSPMYDPFDDGVLEVSEQPAAPVEPSEAPAESTEAPDEKPVEPS